MKEVIFSGEFPRCDSCNKPQCGVYNTPTSPRSPLSERWANLCGPCFSRYGIDTSTTELRVHTKEIPAEVKAITLRWCGEPHEMVKVADDVWRVWNTDTGETYDVHKPGAEFAWYEDDGRPGGKAVFPHEWAVRPIAAAPDDWFTVNVDGTHRGFTGEEVKVW